MQGDGDDVTLAKSYNAYLIIKSIFPRQLEFVKDDLLKDVWPKLFEIKPCPVPINEPC